MDASVYLMTKRIQLLDMRKQLAADLFLIGIREPGNFRDGLFECSDHERKLVHFLPDERSKIWSGRRESNPRMQLGKDSKSIDRISLLAIWLSFGSYL
jgi:hypothetical protein